MTDASGITTYRYDAFGNLRQQTKTELGVSYTTSYTYDAGNRVNTLTYPDGRILTYTRDAIGRISDISMTVGGTTTSLLNGISYRADGLIKSQTFGNGLTETRAYDLQGRLTSQTVGNIINQTYSYDANGNLVTLPEGTYSYDVLDRLIQTSLSTQNNRYTYEGNGDILNASFSIIQSSIRNDRYTYTSDGQLASYTQNDIPTASYTYNAQHQRTRKVANSTTIYHYDLQGNLIQESDSTGAVIRSYVWLNQTPIAQIDRNGTTETLTYLHVDHLNTPRWGTNSTGVLVWQWAGEAFGQDQPEEDPDQDGNLTTVNLRYPGQYYDAESGLHYNWNRYYDPRTGRYITSDPIGLRGGLNTYAYVDNNPLRFTDPLGLIKWTGTIKAGMFLTGGGALIEVQSECVNGKRGYVTAIGAGAGLGVGAKLPKLPKETPTGTGGNVEFEDGRYGVVDPNGFNGTFVLASSSLVIGKGPSLSGVQCGNAIADVGLDWPKGLDVSYGFLVGTCTVIKSEIRDCDDCKK